MNRTQKKKNLLQNTIQMGGGLAYDIVDIRTYDIRGGDLGLFINLCQKAKNNVNIGYNVFVLLKEPNHNSKEWTFETFYIDNINKLFETLYKPLNENKTILDNSLNYTHAAAMWAADKKIKPDEEEEEEEDSDEEEQTETPANDEANQCLLYTLTGHKHFVNSVALDSNHIVSGSADGKINVWKRENGELVHELDGGSLPVNSVALDSNHIVSGSADGKINVWNRENGKLVHKKLNGHQGQIYSVALNEQYIVSGSMDNTIKVWDLLNNGALMHTLTGHSNYVKSVAIDGKHIVSGSKDDTIMVWDLLNNGALMHTLTGHNNTVTSVAIKGKHIVSGSKDNTIKVWDREKGVLMRTITGHEGAVLSVAFDGQHIVSGSKDKTIKVWNHNTGALTHTITVDEDFLTSVALDGQHIVSGSDDKTIKVFNIGSCISEVNISNESNNNLTPINKQDYLNLMNFITEPIYMKLMENGGIVLDGDGNVVEFRVANKELTAYLLEDHELGQLTFDIEHLKSLPKLTKIDLRSTNVKGNKEAFKESQTCIGNNKSCLL